MPWGSFSLQTAVPTVKMCLDLFLKMTKSKRKCPACLFLCVLCMHTCETTLPHFVSATNAFFPHASLC